MPDHDELASAVERLGQRMDCFYSWATQLQLEIRELKRARVAGRTAEEELEASLQSRIDALRAC